MGYSELLERCIRISCARLVVCLAHTPGFLKNLVDLLLRRVRGVPAYDLVKEEHDEEDLGLLTEVDLGLEEAIDLKDDAQLLERAKELVDKKAAQHIAKGKVYSPVSSKGQSNHDEEEAWLDNLNSELGSN